LSRIGGSGGFMGHVLLAAGTPTCVQKHSPEAEMFLRVWPTKCEVSCIWLLRTIECTRGTSGLCEQQVMLYIDAHSRELICFGEVHEREDCIELIEIDNDTPQVVELWCFPRELRQVVFPDLMEETLTDLKSQDASWSWATAVRAFVLPGQLTVPNVAAAAGPSIVQGPEVLEEIQKCWAAEPICTSVIVAFWQRYFCRLAQSSISRLDDDTLGLDMILKWMPLKADRVLPGELLVALRSHGWEIFTSIPMTLSCEEEGVSRRRSLTF